MSGILKRTALAEVKNAGGLEFIKFFDWNMCITELGTMFELAPINQRYPKDTARDGTATDVPEYDPEDMISMVNKIQFIDTDKHRILLGNDVHSVLNMLRVGR